MHMKRFTALACVACAALLPALGAHGAPAATPTLAWKRCPASLTGDWPELGDRLRCATFDAPLDHGKDDTRTIKVGVVRIAAARPDRREGSLFVNIGGPGGNPARLLPSLAAFFSAMDEGDPVHGDQRRLGDRFDLVGVIPRGLRGGWQMRCLDGYQATHTFVPTHRDDANWQRLLDDARKQVDECASLPEAPFVNTLAHVHDMEWVRQAQGDARIQFLGMSYGGRVGAWYAAAYPQRIDRMVLDSSMAIGARYLDNVYASLDGHLATFEREQLGPLLASPARWGLTGTRSALDWKARSPHPLVREAWYSRLATPQDLAAGMAISQWLDHGGLDGWAALSRRVEKATFSPDPAVDSLIRQSARALVKAGTRLGEVATPAGADLVGADGAAVNLATLCNDDAWETRPEFIRARIDRDAFAYPTDDGDHATDLLACAAWPHHRVDWPDLSPLAARADMVLLQSEFDQVTPASAARHTMRRFPNARLLLAKGATQHGLFAQSDTPCVEQGAARYLLDGTLPANGARETSCPFVALPEGSAYDYYDYDDS
jgi:pimeloyl-ACP methyl ester carboxylesterase